MPITNTRIPEVDKCCGCVTDLKTAAAIIAVLGIVTSPAVSWAVVRHSFVIRMSCFVTTSAVRADVVDINLNNILSFGFGANAGLGPSCLGPKNNTKTPVMRTAETEAGSSSGYVSTVRWMGWLVLIADIIFLGFSIHFLYKLFKPPDRKAAKQFMLSCVVAITFSFVYGMLYVGACISVGGAFPVFEFIFCIIDVLTYSSWLYFALVIRSYIRYCDREELLRIKPPLPSYPVPALLHGFHALTPYDIWNMLFEYISAAIGYITL